MLGFNLNSFLNVKNSIEHLQSNCYKIEKMFYILNRNHAAIEVRLHSLKTFLLDLLNYNTFMFDESFGYKLHVVKVENRYVNLIKKCIRFPKYSYNS